MYKQRKPAGWGKTYKIQKEETVTRPKSMPEQASEGSNEEGSNLNQIQASFNQILSS